jgi:hypothetical protein
MCVQVTELMKQLEKGVRKAGQVNEWFATHRPADILGDLRGGRVTFIATELVTSLSDEPVSLLLS